MSVTDLLIGIAVGSVAGWLIGKHWPARSSDFSGIVTQVSVLKERFDQIEKSRNKLDEVREKRIKEWVEGTTKLFREIDDKGKRTDEEKDKRIKEWMESTKKFFAEQKKATEDFLKEQGKSREEIDKRRDVQLKDMQTLVETFTRTVTGTKKRGMVGEDILNRVLHNSIKANIVKKNLRTGGGDVEFAWDLGDGKYIPIDSKFPDILELVSRFNESEDADEQRTIVKKILDKVKNEITRVQKYQNQQNTIDCCILVVPRAVMEIAPELVGIGKDVNVFVCSYQDVFPIAHVLEDQYHRTKEEGDIGKYKQITKALFSILEKINKKVDTIDRATKQISNADEEIKEEIGKSTRLE